MSAAKVFDKIIKVHDNYIQSLSSLASFNEGKLTPEEKIDRVAFHVIEEIIEMRRNYHRKFWKQTKQETNIEQLKEEAADVFLMARSMWLEVCKACGINEETFLEIILKKARVNQERRSNGY